MQRGIAWFGASLVLASTATEVVGLGFGCVLTGIADDRASDKHTLEPSPLGLLAGTILTATIDIGLMSHEPSEQPLRGSASSLAPTSRLMPMDCAQASPARCG